MLAALASQKTKKQDLTVCRGNYRGNAVACQGERGAMRVSQALHYDILTAWGAVEPEFPEFSN